MNTVKQLVETIKEGIQEKKGQDTEIRKSHPSRHNESCLTTARYCPGRGQYCAVVRQKTLTPNNGMSCHPGTLARGRLEADYYKVFP